MANGIQAYHGGDSSGSTNDWPGHDNTARSSTAVSTAVEPEKIDTRNDSDTLERESMQEAEIHNLAHELTRLSSNAPAFQFPVQNDSPLDPQSTSFSARKWAKAYYESRVVMSEGNIPRVAGLAFKSLDVYGFGTTADFQKTIANTVLDAKKLLSKLFNKSERRIDILHDLEGVVQPGEMLCVLGPPGSGCSTLLRTIAGDTHGFHVGKDATLNYRGIRPEQIKKEYRGEAIYTAEVDHHFPHFTVGDTLYFAARARCPRVIPEGSSRTKYAEHLRDVIMALLGISHTKNTRVGDDFVRGVSGGERKRVTIAEAALGFAPLQCWDNSTRGLDSAYATEFCRTLRIQADVMGCTSCVAIYQAPQVAYELFDKVTLLYEGHQIFFGRTDEARGYFENLGFVCPEQQTTPDFLTSMTSHSERVVRPGWEGRTPVTAEEFAGAWKSSRQRASLMNEIELYAAQHPFDGSDHETFLASRRMDQSKYQRAKSPFNLSYWEQVMLTLWRSWKMLKQDPSITVTMLIANLFEAIIIASIFYNLPADTTSLFHRSVLLFFIVLMNAFGSVLEILTLYSKRKIIEKQSRYAFYHASAEALSAMIADLPYKIANNLFMNSILYFMCNLRREPGPFFFFLLFSFAITLSMSMMFRFIGSITKSVSQALAPTCIILLGLILYSGFAIPTDYMHVWLGWLRWVNPVFYGMESVFLNEFIGRVFPCSDYVPSGPGYESTSTSHKVCSTVGSVSGVPNVDGAAYVSASYGFQNAHRWRNLAVIICYTLLFMVLHLIAIEYVASERSKGEVLVFTRAAMKKHRQNGSEDIEVGAGNLKASAQRSDSSDDTSTENVNPTGSTFHWQNVCYDVDIKGETRRILDHVDGWVKPGTLTALMGVSGAGKTTLLDVLAKRVTMGVISGEMLVQGEQRDSSFQRKTGYVQQQDLHLHTSTVREALNFSALLRQPAHYTREEKLAYVDTVIELLGMQSYSDAVIGVPSEGLNVEQRKRLTIGVELAARPELLLFLDEPTSGLDSQTSWSICDLMEKLTKNGQAILCTIHQPSAMLFQRFDRLLLLAKGGKTVYFGPVGKNSNILMDYFVRNGGPALPANGNPAEHMLTVIGATPESHSDIEWPSVWRSSPEYEQVQNELARLASGEKSQPRNDSEHQEFAATFQVQLKEVTRRAFQQYWRSPSYIYSKWLLSAGAALFIGLSTLNSDNTIRGLQNQLFGVFLFLTIFSQIVEQVMPVFCQQRTLYEARERPSKSYSWQSFMLASIAVELAWNSLMSVFSFLLWYFPIGLFRNAEWTNQVHERGMTIFMLIWAFFVMTSTFSTMLIAGLPNADIAGGVLTLLFIMMFAFCGVLLGPQALPGFWIFMYRVNPFTYVVEGFLGTTLANAPVNCATNEILTLKAPANTTCHSYMSEYIAARGGQLLAGSGDGTECQFCPMANTNEFLASINSDFGNRWRDFGLIWAYPIFNIAAALFLYWIARVPKTKKIKSA